ncbi:TetR/AcrR family transcriptional regulator [Plantactinospora sp. CA-294935]|uniref:TetR/AcrR family transcriptional regulator n=1 Tax=Plantactinospora sp. CA-294935 TaxID=3240012 RepID=UPI003D905848
MSSDGSVPDLPDSRTRILAAALHILREQAEPSMGMIAARAGLSRQAVYLHFDSRDELLVAVADWANATIGLPERLDQVAQAESARRMLGLFIDVAVWHASQIGPAIRTLDRIMETDSALAERWRTRNGRAAHAARIIDSLAKQRQLRPDLSTVEATTLLGALTRPDVITDLLNAGLAEITAAQLLQRAVEEAVCNPGGR